MPIIVNVAGQVGQIKLSTTKALWPLFETVINSIQSLEDSNVDEKKIVINALRPERVQLKTDGQGKMTEELNHFETFVVTDNGNGFNTENYTSFLEAYSQLKVRKGCKGIGRFLWLKAFDKVTIKSTYFEDDLWHLRSFDFSLTGVNPEQNDSILKLDDVQQQTIVSLDGFKNPYRDSVAYSLESLAKKIIEHCLPYFITGKCPQIILKDNRGESFNLNSYYEKTYKDSLHQDPMELRGKHYTLYHMLLTEGADKHELHLCANNREVKSYALSNYIPDMKKKLVSSDDAYYYVGYLAGDYLDEAVNTERSDFDFSDGPMFSDTREPEIVETAVGYIRAYLSDELTKVADEKKTQIDMLVKTKRPQYRLLLNRHPEVYDRIPAGLPEDKLDLELYKQQQQWELDTAKKKHDIEEKVKQDATSDPSFQKLFDEYCENITELSRASLAEYVVRRKAVIDLLEQALEVDEKGKYSKESRIHSIICPMQTTSDEIKLDDMNLWLIDDRMAYHHFLASDKKINTIPVLDSAVDKRMDLAIFDAALSYTADPENINSITIVELKRPQRNDLAKEETDPIAQVYDYVTDIKEGKVKKSNGRGFANVQQVAFYCYVIADVTPTLKKSAARAGLVPTQDGEGYFGYNQTVGTYIEVISYDKLLKDAKQRNRALFDKLFEPKSKDLVHPELIR
ncbi:hypothetical protein [Anaerotignum lactatifermentans]|uniref:Histidine kinase-, DNA gyrase B-, and HSP90-like ATPase n=1 Tax=Anaerotignum lactatifermentans DSM 14214 TaxID=1121323 RepID=A0A1M6N6J0_9FIRM|nr:hypothetical protein [Anaerotignum lactatifermentans]SHJ91176.1 hypothetical protein SAMN02745138_00778 [[Clostridium] lactatifermentans DSM 14214] [Anaerotignum lactatifermentans DSM 14214]